MFSNTPLDFLTYLDVFSNTCNKVISIKFVFPKAKTVNYWRGRDDGLLFI